MIASETTAAHCRYRRDAPIDTVDLPSFISLSSTHAPRIEEFRATRE